MFSRGEDKALINSFSFSDSFKKQKISTTKYQKNKNNVTNIKETSNKFIISYENKNSEEILKNELQSWSVNKNRLITKKVTGEKRTGLQKIKDLELLETNKNSDGKITTAHYLVTLSRTELGRKIASNLPVKQGFVNKTSKKPNDLRQEMRNTPIKTKKGQVFVKKTLDLVNNDEVTTEITLNLDKNGESEIQFGDNSLTWTVSTQSDWENGTLTDTESSTGILRLGQKPDNFTSENTSRWNTLGLCTYDSSNNRYNLTDSTTTDTGGVLFENETLENHPLKFEYEIFAETDNATVTTIQFNIDDPNTNGTHNNGYRLVIDYFSNVIRLNERINGNTNTLKEVPYSSSGGTNNVKVEVTDNSVSMIIDGVEEFSYSGTIDSSLGDYYSFWGRNGSATGTKSVTELFEVRDGDGSYVSEWHDWGGTEDVNEFIPDSTLNGETVTYTIEVSDDSSTVKDSVSGSLTGGQETIDISSLDSARYVRVKFDLNTSSVTNSPEVNSFEVNTVSLINLSVSDSLTLNENIDGLLIDSFSDSLNINENLDLTQIYPDAVFILIDTETKQKYGINLETEPGSSWGDN